jgi:hypothetical protein
MFRRVCGWSLALLIVIPATGFTVAKGWKKIPEPERSLGSVPFAPDAPAVVLMEKGHLVVSPKAVSSYLEVHRRVKVLNDAGRAYGTVRLFSSDYYRMKELIARTVLPDGRELSLPDDAVFNKEYSDYYGRELTSLAMPEVTPGAIVEYRYKIFFDSLLYPAPWYFQSELPTLHSEYTAEFPRTFGFSYHFLGPEHRSVEPAVDRSSKSFVATYVLKNLPPVPDEPFSPPFEDQSMRAIFLPRKIGSTPILQDWASVVGWFQGTPKTGYGLVRRHDGTARSAARKMLGEAASQAENAEILFRFVRDEIALRGGLSVQTGDRSCDKILADREGTRAEQAVLLQVMLKAAGIESSLAWAGYRELGKVHQEIPNPAQFDTVLVAAELEGATVFLDPSDPEISFGRLYHGLEGIDVLLVDRKPLEWAKTPTTPFAESMRSAQVKLVVDEVGRISGEGSLTLTGHSAWNRIGWKSSKEETISAWRERLADGFPGFDVSGVRVDENVETQRVEVAWTVVQREEEVLGDEVTVSLAAPLAIESNPFSLPSSVRKNTVELSFPSCDRVELELEWPESWMVEAQPHLKTEGNLAGLVKTDIQVDEEGHRLTASRQFDRTTRTLRPGTGYQAIQLLYRAGLKNDAEVVVLARQ